MKKLYSFRLDESMVELLRVWARQYEYSLTGIIDYILRGYIEANEIKLDEPEAPLTEPGYSHKDYGIFD